MNKSSLVGQKLRLRLDSWGRLGEAMARVDGRPIFVAGGIPGEEVIAEVVGERRRRLAARVVEVITPSPHRASAPCPYFGPCTGCQWQHVDYNAQLGMKRDAVVDALERVGGFSQAPVAPTLPSPDRYGYRNHARFTIGPGGSLGFVNRESRQMVPIDNCMLMHPGVNGILAQLQGRCAETTQLSVRYGVNTGDFLVQPPLTNPAVPIPTGQKRYVESLRGRRFRVASPSFFQVNVRQMDNLVELVGAALGLSGSELIVDAYAGVGTFALLLAPRAGRIIAIEESPAAVEDARDNASGDPKVEFMQGRTEDALAQLDEQPHGVILDPPRKGCHPSVLKALDRLRPAKVVYVSCDPATLARDLKVLCQRAFHLESVQPIDMFPQTHHVECVATLRPRRAVEGLILASSSPRRRDLMESLGPPLKVAPPNIPETVAGDSPQDTVRRLALAKAQAVAARLPNPPPGSPIVGADTLVVCDGVPLGKPKNPAEAVDMLKRLRGRRHTVITGVAVIDPNDGASVTGSRETAVTLPPCSDLEIDRYVASGAALDKAGGYGLQDEPFHSGAEVEGCRANVVGLPLCALADLLGQLGYDTQSLRLPDPCRAHPSTPETAP